MAYFDDGFNTYFVHQLCLLLYERFEIHNQCNEKVFQERKILNTSKLIITRQVMSLLGYTFVIS